MKVGKRIPVVGGDDKDAVKLLERSKTWHHFSQYTDIEALLCILRNKELKANCIKNVDDRKEQTYLQPLIDNDEALPYVSCFDHRKAESIPLWNMYAGNKYGVKVQFDISDSGLSSDFSYALIDKNRDVKGCRPGFAPVAFCQSMHEDHSKEYPKVWVHISAKPVVYKNSLENTWYQLPADDLLSWSTLATIKSKDWKFQNEIRIIAAFSHTDYTANNDNVKLIDIPYFDYLLLPIHFRNVAKITITFSPWMGEETKRLIEKSIKEFELDCKCVFTNSCFDGIIRKK